MIKGYIERTNEAWKGNLEYLGYGNANIIEAFKMEDIDIKKVMEGMKAGEIIRYNIW